MLNRLFASRKRPFIPNRDQRDTVEIDLSGTKLRLSLPPHSDYEGFQKDKAPSHVNIYDTSAYSEDSHLADWQREGISHQVICERNWEFYGPVWRTRPYGHIGMRIVLCRHDLLPENMSCFNPNHFEQIAIRSAYFNGPARPTSAKCIAPINWSLKLSSENTWIYFEDRPDFNGNFPDPESAELTKRSHIVRIPIEDRYFILINFQYLGYSPASICLANMDELRLSLMNSIECQLSSSANEQLIEAKKRWPTSEAQANREPESWTYPIVRDGNDFKGEDELIIVERGSPPPLFTP